MPRKSIPFYVLLFASFALLLPSGAFAKKSKTKTKDFTAYAVEFACGEVDAGGDGVPAIQYGTSLTLANLGEDGTLIRARAQTTRPDSVDSDRVEQRLAAGQARSFDCRSILGGLFDMRDPEEDGPDFVQGLLIIESREPIQVTVRNTATGGDGSVALDIREVSGTKVKVRVADHRDKDEPVDVCHVPPGNHSNRHTITIDPDSVGAHLRHGDTEGECRD